MSDSPAQTIVALYWGMVVAGAGLSGFGICRRLSRYQQLRDADCGDETEIVIGDSLLRVGQHVTIATGIRVPERDLSSAVDGRIGTISRRHCVIEIEPEFAIGSPRPRPLASRPLHGPYNGLNRGDSIMVTLTFAQEAYRFTARVRELQVDAGAARLVVTRPGTLARLQRRRYVRAALNAPATFERHWQTRAAAPRNSSDASPSGGIVHGSVQDISGGGLRANVGGVLSLHELDRLLDLFPPDAAIRVCLPFPALDRNAVLARIRTAKRTAVRGGLTLQVTCEFLPLQRWEQEIVIRHVSEILDEYARTGSCRHTGLGVA